MMDRNVIDDAWLKSGPAVRLLGCRPRVLARLAEQGLIGRRELPGCYARYSKTDVERLARAATRPATADALERVATGVACEC